MILFLLHSKKSDSNMKALLEALESTHSVVGDVVNNTSSILLETQSTQGDVVFALKEIDGRLEEIKGQLEEMHRSALGVDYDPDITIEELQKKTEDHNRMVEIHNAAILKSKSS